MNAVSTLKIRWMHVTLGQLSFGLGLWIFYTQYFYVIDFLKGFIQPVTIILGLVSLGSGIRFPEFRVFKMIGGLLLLGVGGYGFYDEYYATMDFFTGCFPVVFIIAGIVTVISGILSLD